jgi:TetR/AcrR family transcriptional regulator
LNGSKLPQHDQLGKLDTESRKNQTILSARLMVFSQFGFRGSTLDLVAERRRGCETKPAPISGLRRLHSTGKTAGSGWNLCEINADGDPLKNTLAIQTKTGHVAASARNRLFIMKSSKRAASATILRGELRELVDEIAVVINGWAAAGCINKDRSHLMLASIWAQTQHYADFDVQVRAILGKARPFDGAEQTRHLRAMLRGLLTP